MQRGNRAKSKKQFYCRTSRDKTQIILLFFTVTAGLDLQNRKNTKPRPPSRKKDARSLHEQKCIFLISNFKTQTKPTSLLFVSVVGFKNLQVIETSWKKLQVGKLQFNKHVFVGGPVGLTWKGSFACQEREYVCHDYV